MFVAERLRKSVRLTSFAESARAGEVGEVHTAIKEQVRSMILDRCKTRQ